MTDAFDPSATFIHLDGPAADVLPVDADFWPRVTNGDLPLPGWLGGLSTYEPSREPGHSEVHPRGAEVHFCHSGAVTVVLEHDGGDERVDLTTGSMTVIPAGVWHHLEASEPSRVLTLTFGEGTEHRPAGHHGA